MEYEWLAANPITLVRQGGKRTRIPVILDIGQMGALLSNLAPLERTAVLLAQIASTKHEDVLMHTTVIFATPHAVATGYLRVFATRCQPAMTTSRSCGNISKQRWTKR